MTNLKNLVETEDVLVLQANELLKKVEEAMALASERLTLGSISAELDETKRPVICE